MTDILKIDNGKSFQSFLQKCRNAINQIEGYSVSVSADFWSTLDRKTEKTYWQILKDTGKLQINDRYYAIDFDFGARIYADIIE